MLEWSERCRGSLQNLYTISIKSLPTQAQLACLKFASFLLLVRALQNGPMSTNLDAYFTWTLRQMNLYKYLVQYCAYTIHTYTLTSSIIIHPSDVTVYVWTAGAQS